jgi:hypothetical protein
MGIIYDSMGTQATINVVVDGTRVGRRVKRKLWKMGLCGRKKINFG